MGYFLLQYVKWNNDLLINPPLFFIFNQRRIETKLSGWTIRLFIKCNLLRVSPYRCILCSCLRSEHENMKPHAHGKVIMFPVMSKKTKHYVIMSDIQKWGAHSHQSVWKYQFLAIIYLIKVISISAAVGITAFCNREEDEDKKRRRGENESVQFWVFFLFFCDLCSKGLTHSLLAWQHTYEVSDLSAAPLEQNTDAPGFTVWNVTKHCGSPDIYKRDIWRLRCTCILDHMVIVGSLGNRWNDAVYRFQVLSSPICWTGKIVTFMENIMIHPHTVKTVRMTFSFRKHLPSEMPSICVLPSWGNKHRFPLYLFRYF